MCGVSMQSVASYRLLIFSNTRESDSARPVYGKGSQGQTSGDQATEPMHEYTHVQHGCIPDASPLATTDVLSTVAHQYSPYRLRNSRKHPYRMLCCTLVAMSGTQNPEALPKYQWETLKGSGSQDGVTHVIHDPHDSSPTPGSSRSETWESYKQPIGSGGQGTVFLQGCTSGSRVGQCRALKVIHCREAKRQKQYLREIEAMAKFSNERVWEGSTYISQYPESR